MLNQEFKVPAKLKTTSMVLLGIGVITLIAGVIALLLSKEQLSSGTYFYQLKVSNYVESKKMILMK